jgi:hypothetical protein
MLSAGLTRGLHLTLAPVFADVARLPEVCVMLHGLDGSLLLVRSELMRCPRGFRFHIY